MTKMLFCLKIKCNFCFPTAVVYIVLKIYLASSIVVVPTGHLITYCNMVVYYCLCLPIWSIPKCGGFCWLLATEVESISRDQLFIFILHSIWYRHWDDYGKTSIVRPSTQENCPINLYPEHSNERAQAIEQNVVTRLLTFITWLTLHILRSRMHMTSLVVLQVIDFCSVLLMQNVIICFRGSTVMLSPL